MNSFECCEHCKKWHWSQDKCDPIFLVYYEDYMGDDPEEVRGRDHEDAAINFAKSYNAHSDYALINETINVRVEKDGVVKYFEVGAEPSIHYNSKETPKPLT